jgi:two-component system, OmpR family, response regulator
VRVLIVEDKVKMAGLLRRALRGEGLAADVAGRGEDAVWMAAFTRYDAVVLDVMLPGIDGIETCRRLRADGQWALVLMLTARGQVADRIAGLDGGADDYLTKPFELGELMARLRALVRRGPIHRATILRAGDSALDPATRRVWRGEEPIELPPKCFSLLEALMRQAAGGPVGLGLREPLQRGRPARSPAAGADRPAVSPGQRADRPRRLPRA